MTYDAKDLKQKWEVKSVKKAPKALKTKIDLEFTPSDVLQAYTNKIVAAVRLDQVFGTFSGTIVLENEEVLEVREVAGGRLGRRRACCAPRLPRLSSTLPRR